MMHGGRRGHRWLVLLFVCLCCACGCDSSDDDDSSDESDDTSDDDTSFPFSDLDVKWETCSLYEGSEDGRAECAKVEMPLDWFHPDERTFTVAAKRLLSSNQPAEAQLWLLHGGPGASGTIGFPYFMESIQEDYPELDVYTLDPRGSGFSEYLGCPDQEASSSPSGDYIDNSELNTCITYLQETYGEDLGGFNTTNPAIDLAAFIDRTKEEGKRVLVWGGSGGTFWGQRYLQFFPDQANGMIFEGNVPPVFSLVFQDEYADKATRAIFDLCSEDSLCSSKLPDPEGTLQNLYTKMTDEGHCSETGYDPLTVKYVIDQLVYYWPYHDMVPAFVYRLDRCNDADMEAVVNLYYAIFGGGKKALPEDEHEWTTDQRYFSDILFFNESFSELWEYPDFPTNQDLLDYLDGVYADSLMGFGKGYDRNDLYLKWPRYTDPHDDTWPVTEVPMLMMQGKLDPATPYDLAVKMSDYYTAPHQTFVAFPYAAHNVSGGTPMGVGADVEDCANNLFVAFMKNPDADLDLSCVDQTVPPDFEGTAYAPYYFGTADYWENPAEDSEKVLERREAPLRLRAIERQMAHDYWALSSLRRWK